MTRVSFVVGHEDTPEAYWRVALPARHLRAPMVLAGAPGAQEAALGADVVWIHEPTSIAAADLAEKGAAHGRTVIVDLSEDPWVRHEIDGAYNEHRLSAMGRAMDAATLLVVTSAELAEALGAEDALVLPPVTPMADAPGEPVTPKALGWWSDGRQKTGFEEVAPALVELLRETDIGLRHIGFAHMRPVAGNRMGQGQAELAARQRVYLYQDNAAASWRLFGRALSECLVSLDCYPGGRYRETVSDLSILRAAALGVPTITTRSDAPPGALSVPAGEWLSTLRGLYADPDRRLELSRAARAWARTRTSFAPYEQLLQEVA